MVPALKLAATLSVVGVIVSEISTGVTGGIGRAVISYSQAATGDPAKVYAAVFGAAVLGLIMYGLVVLFDIVRDAQPAAGGRLTVPTDRTWRARRAEGTGR